MESQSLFNKYLDGEHWKNRAATYASEFADFLRQRNFSGLLVDIGCGNGRDTNLFYQHGINVIGIDHSEKEIAEAKSNFPQCRFKIQNAENMNFADESAGAIFMINVLHYTNQNVVLNEINKILAKDGYALIHFNTQIKDQNNVIDYHQNEKEILGLVSRFKIVENKLFERTDIFPHVHTHKIMELILQK